MDVLDPIDRRRAQNRRAQRRFRERCQQRLSQSIAIQTEASSNLASASASESCSAWTSGDMVPHYLTLQSEILPDATKEPENSLFPDNFDTFLIHDNIFSPTPDLTHLSETLPSSSSADLESRGPLLGLDARQDALTDSESLTFSSGAQRTTSLPTASWESPLHIAAQKGHSGIAQLLLEHHVDCNEKDSDGLTPLAHAIRGDHEAAVRLLLSHGARLDYTDGPGCSVFHCAVIHRREALLRLFASHCAADLSLLDAFDLEGMTPLHRAVATNFEAGVRILLHHGASAHHRVRKGR
ncbi:MAG: hypothetical protein M1818_003668 [Claussenomyces sp. TS43310]|nr:MAG: hypothetical protein M1818_003668 [Claussenomyces sp. TS43310]